MIKKMRFSGLQNIFSLDSRFSAKNAWLFVFVIGTVFSMTTVSSANFNGKGDKPSLKFGGVEVDVENFGKVTDFYYRGAQPEEDEYQQLANIGVKTIIDLRNDPKDYAKPMSLKAGMRYINLPMSDKSYPSSDAADKFLSLVNDSGNWPVYVHCAGGRHRTGAMTAVFRMKMQGWGIDKAYEEMKDYDFYTRWGHKAMKTYVFDFYQGLKVNNGFADNTIEPKVSQVSGKESLINR